MDSITMVRRYFSPRLIGYNPMIAKVLGSVTAGVLLAQLMYWSETMTEAAMKKGHEFDGWFYKTGQDLYNETGLSRYEQETARRRLRNLGIIQEERKGLPARLYYQVNWQALIEVLGGEPEQEWDDAPDKNGGNHHTVWGNPSNSMLETTKQESANPPNIPTPHEITSEITTEITSESKIAPSRDAAPRHQYAGALEQLSQIEGFEPNSREQENLVKRLESKHVPTERVEQASRAMAATLLYTPMNGRATWEYKNGKVRRYTNLYMVLGNWAETDYKPADYLSHSNGNGRRNGTGPNDARSSGVDDAFAVYG